MPVSFACSSCSAKLRAPDGKAGRKVKCPKCAATVVIPDTAQERTKDLDYRTAPPPERARQAQPVVVRYDQRPVPTVVPAGGYLDPEPQPVIQPAAAAVVSTTVVVNQAPRSSNSLGVAALVIGVLSFFTCWIPFLGIAVSGLGLALGLGGFVTALGRRGTGIGFAIAGSGLCGITLCVCMVWTVGMYSMAKDTVERAKQNRANQTQKTDAKPGR